MVNSSRASASNIAESSTANSAGETGRSTTPLTSRCINPIFRAVGPRNVARSSICTSPKSKPSSTAMK